MQSDADSEQGETRQPGQTYPKLFHLFFLQARGVKIEAWLKDKFTDWGRGEIEVTRLCRRHATTNKQEMTGDEKTPGIGHLPISTLKSVCYGLVLCGMVLKQDYYV